MAAHAQGMMAVVAVVVAAAACSPRGARHLPAPPGERIVCLGDSITDGCTYPQIIAQALREARRPVPALICAGVASDTAPQMAARLEKTVLVFKPTLVTFSAGTNDALRGVTPAQYEQALRGISAKVKAQGGSMLLLTPCIINAGKGADAAAKAKAEAAEKVIAQYIVVIRKVAAARARR